MAAGKRLRRGADPPEKVAWWLLLVVSLGLLLVVGLAEPCGAQEDPEGPVVVARAPAAEDGPARAPGRDGHPSAAVAAAHALVEAMAAGARREHAGIVYAVAGAYGYTAPRRARVEGGFTLRLRPGRDFPREARVVALYHTHPAPAGRHADAHSPHDVATARELGLVSYVGVVESGEIRRYDPEEPARAPVGYPRGAHRGELVPVPVRAAGGDGGGAG